MKRIVIMNCITISLIVILSYISTPDNQPLANHYLLIGFGSVIAFMTFLWIISLLVKDASIVDIFWGPAFIVLGSSLLISMDQVYSERSLFILFLTGRKGLAFSILAKGCLVEFKRISVFSFIVLPKSLMILSDKSLIVVSSIL